MTTKTCGGRHNCSNCGASIPRGTKAVYSSTGTWAHIECPAPAPASAPVASEPRREERRNRYAGTCENCGRHLPAGAGILYTEGAEWLVRCPTCSIG